MNNREASAEFRQQLNLVFYTVPDAHPQDLPACYTESRRLDSLSERMWAMAFRAGVAWAEEQGFIWDYADRDEV